MIDVLKEGPLRMWLKNNNKWINVYCKLHNNGHFVWYENMNSKKPIFTVNLKLVAAYIALGSNIYQVPQRPPNFSDAEMKLMFGIPHESNMQTEMTFFMCSNQSDMNDWMTCIFMLFGETVPPEYQTQPLYQNQPANFPTHQEQPPPYSPPPHPMYNTSTPMVHQQQFLPRPPTAIHYDYPPQQYGFYPIMPQINQQPVATYNVPMQHPPVFQPMMSPVYPQSMYTTPLVVQQPQQQQERIIRTEEPRRGGGFGLGSAALGAASGFAGGYLANRLFGGGWGHSGGWGGYQAPQIHETNIYPINVDNETNYVNITNAHSENNFSMDDQDFDVSDFE